MENYYNKDTHPDQTYFLDEQSEEVLAQIAPELAEVVRRAVAISDIEIQVVHGRRTRTQQVELFKKGATQRATSPHMYGQAVDLVAIIEGRPCFELEVYDEVALNMKFASEDLHTPVRWGGAWNLDSLSNYEGDLGELQCYYIDRCRERGRRPMLDVCHFELTVAE